jgi:hypothetical protein
VGTGAGALVCSLVGIYSVANIRDRSDLMRALGALAAAPFGDRANASPPPPASRPRRSRALARCECTDAELVVRREREPVAPVCGTKVTPLITSEMTFELFVMLTPFTTNCALPAACVCASAKAWPPERLSVKVKEFAVPVSLAVISSL